MDKYLKLLPSVLLSSFLIKLIILGSNIGDAVIILSLSALYFTTFYFKPHKEEPANKDILNRIIELEQSQSLVKDKVNSINLGVNLKR